MLRNFFKKTTDHGESLLKYNVQLDPEVFDYLNPIVKLDKDGKVISYDEVFVEQFGYTEQDLHNPFFEIFLKDYSSNIRKHFEIALTGKTQSFDAIVVTNQGKPIDYNFTLIPIKQKANIIVYVILKNISDRQKQEQQLNHYIKMREAFDQVEYICNFYYDAINDLLYFSKQFTEMLNINHEKPFTPTLKHFLRYVHPEDQQRLLNTVQNSLKEKVGFVIDYRLIRQDQSICFVREQSGILLDKKGNLEGLVGFIQDITDHKISNDLVEKETHIKMFYDNPDVGIWTMDLQNGVYGEVSKGIEKITGYSQEDFKSLSWNSVVYHEDLEQYLGNQQILASGKILKHQYRIIHKDGSIKWILDYTIPTLSESGDIIQLDGLVSDITEQKMLEEKVQFLANYDVLTKLPNRYQFIEKLEEVISRYTDSDDKFAVIKLDIDGFKYINHTLGNASGDELLKLFSNRLKEHIKLNDTLARRGSDEFLMLIENIKSIEELKKIVQKINECINVPFYINGYELYVTASIGISTYPENGNTSLELMRNANFALKQAEIRGRNNYIILSHSSSIQSFKNFSIGRDLKKAIEDKEMVLYFQPRVDSKTNQIIGAEALIRWNHHEWGLISPHEFLSVAEENGLITAIDDWVLKEVCSQIMKWKKQGLQVVPVSINISAIHFMKPNWPSEVVQIIQDAGILPSDIEFEVTESTILNNSDVVKNTIGELKGLGIKINLDDFGTGYSSLSYLTQFPFDVIKIDKSFIRNMFYSNQDKHLIKSIIYMAKGLNLRVVAEGVETLKQLKMLQQEHCFEIQGYLFSHPVPNNEFESLLQKKTLLPVDPEQKAKESKRKHNRINFPYSLEADIKLVSIAGRSMELGVSKILVEDISMGGLRFVSNLKLPIRGDVVYQFKTELLDEPVTLNGSIVWKEEINEDLVEYGIKFIIEEKELETLSTLLNTFIILLNNSNTLPAYRRVRVDKYQYFK
ncbi:EAL domain-containing protein [Ureibacillus manganicus]|uniref:EAL domain-containing protein n=1 Tax=Ureibacillus manganicus TaxID=1266064 RepID=UPI000691D9D0|nr:EAL domain-containing protein [Ureibacillus manganicus]